MADVCVELEFQLVDFLLLDESVFFTLLVEAAAFAQFDVAYKCVDKQAQYKGIQ